MKSKQIPFLTALLFVCIAAGLSAALPFKDNRLWLDEILSMILLGDPSIGHMTQAITTGIDANPPLFLYVYSVLGSNPMVLKVISILLFAAGVSLFYQYTARSTKRPLPVFMLFLLVTAFTSLNYNLAQQIRSYSLFLLISAGYFIILHRLAQSPGNTKLLVAQAVVGTALAFVHNFGLIYLTSSLVVQGLLFLWSRNRTYWLPILVGAGIFLVWGVIWYPHFLIQAETGKPFPWIARPTVASSFVVVDNLFPRIPGLSETSMMVIAAKVVVAWLGFLALSVRAFSRGFPETVQKNAFGFAFLSGLLFWVIIAVSLVVSILITPVFYNRYLWPCFLLVLAQICSLVQGVPPLKSSALRTTMALGFSLAIGFYLFRQNRKIELFPAYLEPLAQSVGRRYPVFFEMIHEFLPAKYYGLANARFLMNWEVQLKNRDTVDYKIIQAIQEQYAMSEVVRQDQFTPAQYPRFYIMDNTNLYLFEAYLNAKKIRITREIPSPVAGYRILECAWN